MVSRLPRTPTLAEIDECNEDFDDRYADDGIGVYADDDEAWDCRMGVAIEDEEAIGRAA